MVRLVIRTSDPAVLPSRCTGLAMVLLEPKTGLANTPARRATLGCVLTIRTLARPRACDKSEENRCIHASCDEPRRLCQLLQLYR